MFGWRQAIVIESVVKGEGGGGFDNATKNIEEGFLLALVLEDFVWLFPVPTHLMPADPVSRYVEGVPKDASGYDGAFRGIFASGAQLWLHCSFMAVPVLCAGALWLWLHLRS